MQEAMYYQEPHTEKYRRHKIILSLEKLYCSKRLTLPYTTENLPYYLPALRKFQEYFQYNIDVFSLSQLSRASLQINIFQSIAQVNNIPHPSKRKGLN